MHSLPVQIAEGILIAAAVLVIVGSFVGLIGMWLYLAFKNWINTPHGR